jgi:hypothetical protein
LGMYSALPFFIDAAGVPGPAKKSPLQPSATQMPCSSNPHVFPNAQGASPNDLARAIPLEVSAGHELL